MQIIRSFNDLLVEAGVSPSEVRLMRHQTDGKGNTTPYSLWLDDLEGFERYQSTQRSDRPILRKAKYWASFVAPEKGETLFVGLYKVKHLQDGIVEWDCPLRGGLVADGGSCATFETIRTPILQEHIGKLRVAWSAANPIAWLRYADTMNLPLIKNSLAPSSTDALGSKSLLTALVSNGFTEEHSTKKVIRLRRKNNLVYAKRQTDRLALVVHPYFAGYLDRILMIPGVCCDLPVAHYINSNLTEFPEYSNSKRATKSRFGLDLGVSSSALPILADLLDGLNTVDAPSGKVRLVGSKSDPITEQEQLVAARIGQGRFRSDLIDIWQGKCSLTGVDQPELLRASHIKPWASSDNYERLDPYNGLLLAAHIDALFDRGLISFADDGSMLQSPLLRPENIEKIGLGNPQRIFNIADSHKPYLAYHRQSYGF